MNIVEIRPIEGANIYCHKPIIKMKLDLEEYSELTTKDVPWFIENLLECIPSLSEHYCSRGKKGGFVERLNEGTYFGHVTEHVALELQHLAGFDVIYGKTVQAETDNTYYIITEYESKEGGIQALRSAVNIIRDLLNSDSVEVSSEVAMVRKMADNYSLGTSTAAIAREAAKKGIPVMRLGEGSILQLGYGKYQQKVEATITGKTNCIGVDIACDKVLVKQLLAESGIPVPWGGVARTENEALEIAEKIGDSVVVKPFDGNQGKGVALNLSNSAEIIRALEVALNISPKAIVEKFIKGKHYRLTVVGDRVVAAAQRIPAFVIGDGHSTISELVDLINMDPLRGNGHEKPLTKIKIDSVVLMVLAKRGMTPESIPSVGQVVYLRENANLSTGGIAIDVTGKVHPETIQLVLRAVRIIGLDVAGVDLVAKEINKPLSQENGAIIEINAAPGIRMHHYPAKGKPRNVAGAIVEMLFPQGSKCRIPIVSITGTNGKTSVARLIGHIIQGMNSVAGVTTSDGIYINGRKVVTGDTTGPQSARVVLRDPTVEYAVLETARGGILRAGLGYDYSDVGIITNISSDHLGLSGIDTLEDMAFVKSVVAEAVHKNGNVVLNADDENVVSMIQRIKANVIYFSSSSDNMVVRRHLGCGGTAVFIKNGNIVISKGAKTQKVLSVKHVPCTFSGKIQYYVHNVLAAVAGCVGLNISIEHIREGLLSFSADEKNNPGRFNLFEIGSFKVIVDYGHNQAGYLSALQALKKLKPRRVIGVLGMPGDRKDSDIISTAGIAAEYCDYFILKEDVNLRGRKAGEVASIMKEALIKRGIKKDKIDVILPEVAATHKGLEVAKDGDIVIIFYEKFEPILKLISDYKLLLKSNDVGENLICKSIG